MTRQHHHGLILTMSPLYSSKTITVTCHILLFLYEHEHILFFPLKNTCGTHLSIYRKSSRRVQSCALYVNFPCRMVSRLKIASLGITSNDTNKNAERTDAYLSEPEYELPVSTQSTPHHLCALCARFCFVAGDKPVQSCSCWSSSSSSSLNAAPGGRTLFPLARLERTAEKLSLLSRAEAAQLSQLHSMFVLFVGLGFFPPPGYILNFKSLQTQGGACTRTHSRTCTNRKLFT